MNKLINLLDIGGGNMKTIWDYVKFSPNKRPAYTKYEIAKLIREKRCKSNLTSDEFAEKYDTDPSIIECIEKAQRNFNMNIYNICSKILNKSIKELTRFDEEELELNLSFRKEGSVAEDKEAIETVNMANFLFNEMVMQQKLNA